MVSWLKLLVRCRRWRWLLVREEAIKLLKANLVWSSDFEAIRAPLLALLLAGKHVSENDVKAVARAIVTVAEDA